MHRLLYYLERPEENTVMNTSNDRTNNDSDNQHEPLWQRHLREEERQELIKYIQLAESSTKGLVSVEDDPGDPMHRFLRVVVRVIWDRCPLG